MAALGQSAGTAQGQRPAWAQVTAGSLSFIGSDSSGDNKNPRKTAELGTKGIKRSLWADFEEKTYENKLRWTQSQVGRGYQYHCVPPAKEGEETPTNTITNLLTRDPEH